MDVIMQIFKRNICPGTPFFESLAKKPLVIMDKLFRWANKYSMLEDDVRVVNYPTKHDEAGNSKPSNQSRQASKRWDGHNNIIKQD